MSFKDHTLESSAGLHDFFKKGKILARAGIRNVGT